MTTERAEILGDVIARLEGAPVPVPAPSQRDDPRPRLTDYPALGASVWEFVFDEAFQGTGRSGIVVRHLVDEDGCKAVIVHGSRQRQGRTELVVAKLGLDEIDATTIKPPDRTSISNAVRAWNRWIGGGRSWINSRERDQLYVMLAMLELIDVKQAS